MDNKKEKNNFFYAVTLGLELGFLIAAPLILFLLVGLFLDKKFDTVPVFLILFIVLGIIATIFEIFYLILPFLEKRSQKKTNNNNKNS